VESDALVPVCLHWLRVVERVEYNITMVTYKVLCGIAPRYLRPLNRVADVFGRHFLRSSILHQPSRCTTLQTFYGRQPSFSSCCRQDLLTHCRTVSITSLQFFRRHLKTFLFQRSCVSTAVDLAVVCIT